MIDRDSWLCVFYIRGLLWALSLSDSDKRLGTYSVDDRGAALHLLVRGHRRGQAAAGKQAFRKDYSYPAPNGCDTI
jgi:hypothetical protein